MRKLKRPDGELIEEYLCVTSHLFEEGVLLGSDSDSSQGEYTGRFFFKFSDGHCSRNYTRKTAPRWLRVMPDADELGSWIYR